MKTESRKCQAELKGHREHLARAAKFEYKRMTPPFRSTHRIAEAIQYRSTRVP